MIFGDCPYDGCQGDLAIPIPDRPLPCWGRVFCGECGRTIWQKYARYDPECFTEEEFAEQFEIDEQSRQIKKKTLSTAD